MGNYEPERIGIFGGAFDPVHMGHLIIAEQARVQFNLACVYFVPVKNPPLKQTCRANPGQRTEMLRRAVRGNPHFTVSDAEIRRAGPSYTYDTVACFTVRHPGALLYLITGQDAFEELPLWRRFRELAGLAHFLVAPRSPDRPVKKPAGLAALRFEIIASPRVEISSTRVRKLCRDGNSARYLVPDRALDYIKKEKLYGSGKDTRGNRGN